MSIVALQSSTAPFLALKQSVREAASELASNAAGCITQRTPMSALSKINAISVCVAVSTGDSENANVRKVVVEKAARDALALHDGAARGPARSPTLQEDQHRLVEIAAELAAMQARWPVGIRVDGRWGGRQSTLDTLAALYATAAAKLQPAKGE